MLNNVSLALPILVDLVILAAMTWMIQALFGVALGRPIGSIVASVFPIAYVVLHYAHLGPSQRISSYPSEPIHGVALGVLVVALVERAAHHRSWALTGATGAALGLTFLADAECFVSTLVVVAVAGVLVLHGRRPSPTRAGVVAAICLGGAVVTTIAVLAVLLTRMSPAAVWNAIAVRWTHVVGGRLLLVDEYATDNGFLDVGQGALEVLGTTAWLVVAGMIVVTLVLRNRIPGPHIACALIAGGVLGMTSDYPSWLRIARVLPFVCGTATLAFVWACCRHREQPLRRGYFVLALWSVLSLASLGKGVITTHLDSHGVALAMPGLLLLVALVLVVTPRLLQSCGRSKKGGGGWPSWT
jgi:hypothetical protein